MTASEILAALAAPFPAEQISWRVGSMTKDKSKARALAYVDARDVMRRLDAVMGADWQCEYVPMPNGTTCCKISLRIDGEWRSRSNGAGATDIEGEKGGFSDAFKRAAVLWGVGQYLYDVDSPWVKVNEWKQIDESEMHKLRSLLGGTRAHERAPARQEPAPAAGSPAPVDPKKEALDRQTAAATRAAELQRSKQEDAKAKARTFNVALSGFKNAIEGGDVPAFEVRRNYNTWLQTLKASWSSLLADDQRSIKAARDKIEVSLREAEAAQRVAA